MGKKITRRHASIVTLASAYADQSADAGDELVIPEDLTALSTEELETLQARATEAFDALYGEDGAGLTDEQFEALGELTTSIQALNAEAEARAAASAERAAQAAEFAAQVRGTQSAEETDADEADAAEGDADEADAEAAAEVVAEAEAIAADAPEAVVAAAAPVARRESRIPLSAIQGRRTAAPQRTPGGEPSIADYMVASGEGLDVAVGAPLDFGQAGAALNKRLKTFNAKQFENASRMGRQLRQQAPLLQINRPIPEDLQILSNDPEHVRDIFERAADETRLSSPAGSGSLVAAGGWCAPSQVIYDLYDSGESRDGLLSLPEVGVPRGGLSFTPGPDFADLFAAIQNREIGFSFTEADDIAGRYEWDAEDGENVVGPKPCYKVECPPFEEYRLDVDGLCITAGLLQSRGFPEVLADTIRKVLIGHDHYVNGKIIAQMAAGSTPVTLPATQAGAAAPILTSIELQVESYRYARRLSRSATLEAVFPYWVRGAIRSDLARRLGVDLISVADSRIDGWFRERGISPQFVYNWQPISGVAGSVTQWPTTVSFLLYRAGTWIKGGADVITLDTLYDSVMLGNNDFTALFTEEGWFVAKRGNDSRLVTTSLTADGATHAGIEIAHNGTATAPAIVPGSSEDNPLFTSEVA